MPTVNYWFILVAHHMAVGLTAKVDQLALIQTAMNEYAQLIS